MRGERHTHMLVLREGHRRHRGTVTWPLDNTFSASRMLFRASLCNTTQKIAVCSVLAMSSVKCTIIKCAICEAHNLYNMCNVQCNAAWSVRGKVATAGEGVESV